jgi:putative nucleotidyltransferase with HDIG domain
MHGDQHYVQPEQLCLGLYVHLDMGWMDHPFTFSSFLIKTERQIESIRKLGLKRIRYEPSKSLQPPPEEPPPTPAAAPQAEPHSELAAAEVAPDSDAELIAAKKTRSAQLERIKRQIGAVEQQFRRAADSMRSITRNLDSHPLDAHREGTKLVGDLVDTVFGKAEVMLHAMSEKMGDDAYFHPLNVTVLSLILGRALEFDEATLREVGMGALFHDIGKTNLPRSLVAKQDQFMLTEGAMLEQHCVHGLTIARQMNMSEAGQMMLLQHHEYLDGTGYPDRLKGDAIGPLVRVVTIANTYDNLCNPHNIAHALTPSEALSRMFASMRSKLDPLQLQVFIRCLGVYPPGSIVQLSNDMVCLVLSSSSKQPMRPNVFVYDPQVPKEDGLIICLEREPELKIVKSLRPGQLPREIYQYLNPRKRVAYYFDPQPQPGTEQ